MLGTSRTIALDFIKSKTGKVAVSTVRMPIHGAYETAVFEVNRNGSVISHVPLDESHYLTAEAALAGHMDMVKKWMTF